MGVIRHIQDSDRDFIYESVIEYGLTLVKGYEKYAIDIIMDNKYCKTLVYEEDGNPLAWNTIITHPKSFMDLFHDRLSFLDKLKYNISNKLNTLENKIDLKEYMTEEILEIANNIYKQDEKYVYGLFIYNKSRKNVFYDLTTEIYKFLQPKYNIVVGTIRKDNDISIYAHKKVYGKYIELYEYDKEIYMTVTYIDKFLNKS